LGGLASFLDQETYGKVIADQFQKTAEELGIQVLGRESIDGNAPNYRSLMARIAQLNPGAIYFGGITANNAAQLVSDKVGSGMLNEDVILWDLMASRRMHFSRLVATQPRASTRPSLGCPPVNFPPRVRSLLTGTRSGLAPRLS